MVTHIHAMCLEYTPFSVLSYLKKSCRDLQSDPYIAEVQQQLLWIPTDVTAIVTIM